MREQHDGIHDLVIAGAGPAGLSALHAARQAGLRAIAIDKGPVAGALMDHPTYMRWFSTFDKLELGGFPMVCNEKNPTRREYLNYLRRFVEYFDLPVVTHHTVNAVEAHQAAYCVKGEDLFGRPRLWFAHNVVVATGFYDSPRRLNVPGESLPKVTHRYREPHLYTGQRLLVIGGGSSAAEAALDTWRHGAHVTVAMLEQRFQTKYWVEPDIENRITEGSIACYRGTEVLEFRQDEVLLRQDGGEPFNVGNDFVLAMTGYEPDTSMLEAAGVRVDPATGKPELSEHLETNMSGIYVAGTLCAGHEANVVFVENGREHGPAIVRHICDAGGRA